MLLVAASFLFLGCVFYPRVARKNADPEARA
jgi:hypothetical protein